MAVKQAKLTLIKSLNRRTERTQATVSGLGLRRLHSSVVVPLTPENQGMITKVEYLLKVEEI
jgi:large subunit ribosomal protein L30